MGAVNYFTSDYITMGIEPYSAYDLENDPDFMDALRDEVNEYGGTKYGIRKEKARRRKLLSDRAG